MSTSNPSTGASEPAGGPATDPTPPSPSSRSAATHDPLRGSRTSGIWVAVVALGLVLILLAVFILQNTQTTEVNFFAWSGSAPVSAVLLIAAAGGALIVASAGMLRIFQLRRRVKKDLKSR